MARANCSGRVVEYAIWTSTDHSDSMSLRPDKIGVANPNARWKACQSRSRDRSVANSGSNPASKR